MTRFTSFALAITALGAIALQPSCSSEKAAPSAKTPAAATAKTDTPPATKPTGDTPESTAGKRYNAEDAATAKLTWVICATCHGNSGKGDGLAGLALNPKPRSYGDKEWQASVTDERLFKVIKEGGASVGLSPLMVGYPHLSDGAIFALIEKIRGFGK